MLAMRDGGGGKNFGCLRPVWGSSAGSRGLSWRFGAESGGEETRRRGASVMDSLGGLFTCGGGFAARRPREGSSCGPRWKPVRAQRYDSLRLMPVDAAVVWI